MVWTLLGRRLGKPHPQGGPARHHGLPCRQPAAKKTATDRGRRSLGPSSSPTATMTPPALLLVVGAAGVAGVGSLSEDAIPIYHPKHFTVSSVPGTRTPLGLPGDYKPWVAEIKPGELLIVAFCSPCSGPHNSTASKAGKDEEHALFWRSTDGECLPPAPSPVRPHRGAPRPDADGKTWGEREYRQDLHGREWALNVLSDGTLLMPNAILSADVFASAGESGAGVWRSTDVGAAVDLALVRLLLVLR